LEKKYVELQIDRKQVNRCVHYRESVRERSERGKRRERERKRERERVKVRDGEGESER
jgi:hypothetical protein